jgi:hypothetical protein
MLHLSISSSRGESRAVIREVPRPDFITQGVSPRRDAVYSYQGKGKSGTEFSGTRGGGRTIALGKVHEAQIAQPGQI